MSQPLVAPPTTAPIQLVNPPNPVQAAAPLWGQQLQQNIQNMQQNIQNVQNTQTTIVDMLNRRTSYEYRLNGLSRLQADPIFYLPTPGNVNLPLGRPVVIDDLINGNIAHVDNVLNCYGLPVNGADLVKRRRLAEYLGIVWQ